MAHVPIPILAERPAHAKLGASSSKQWLSCTPSMRAGEGEPDDNTEAAQEGTFAHGRAAAKLLVALGRDREALNKFYTEQTQVAAVDGGEDPAGATATWTKFYNQDLEDVVQDYVNRCLEDIASARAETADAIVMVEQVLDFSEWVPEGFGTGDLVTVSGRSIDPLTGEILPGVLRVRDLKFGKGVMVDIVDNSQLRLYAAGAYAAFGALFEFDEIEVTIDQPRMGNIESERVKVADLLTWLEDYVKPRAQLAWEGKGEFVPGAHCRFCRFRRRCGARADAALSSATEVFGDLDNVVPKQADTPRLTNEQILGLIPRLGVLKSWASDMLEWVETQQVTGKTLWPGYKLVEGRSVRVVKDPVQLGGALIAAGFAEAALYKPAELLGLTELSNMVGKKKFDALAKPYLDKPKGRPVLVPVDDPREEFDKGGSPDDVFGGLT